MSIEEPAERQKTDDPLKELAKALAGSFVVVSGTLAFLGATGDGLERILRNHQWWFLFLLVLAGLAIGIGILTPLFLHLVKGRTRPPKVQALFAAWLVLGFVLLGAALTGFSSLAVASKSSKDRPRIEATFSMDGKFATLGARVKAGGLKTKEHILIRVEGHSSKNRLSALHAGLAAAGEKGTINPDGDYIQLVYAARAGGDGDGNVDFPFKVTFSPWLYERLIINAELRPRHGQLASVPRCNEKSGRWGCVQILMPTQAG